MRTTERGWGRRRGGGDDGEGMGTTERGWGRRRGGGDDGEAVGTTERGWGRRRGGGDDGEAVGTTERGWGRREGAALVFCKPGWRRCLASRLFLEFRWWAHSMLTRLWKLGTSPQGSCGGSCGDALRQLIRYRKLKSKSKADSSELEGDAQIGDCCPSRLSQAMIAASAMPCPPHRQLVYEHYTPSLSQSVAFLQSLGFTVMRREAAFAEMGWGPHARLFVEEVETAAASIPAGYHGNIRVMVPDVDAVYRVAVVVPNGAILKPLQDRYYGLRDFTVGGPFGMALRFASPLPGFSED